MDELDIPADLLEHAPCGLLATTPKGHIVAVNETLLVWLGYRRDEVVDNKRFQQLMSLPGRVYYDTHFAPLLRMQGFVHEIAIDLIRADGVALPVFVSANEHRAPTGEVRAIRVAVFQATDRRKYERELLFARRMAEQALKAKADFMAVFAHEVRNAIGAVHLGVQSLRIVGVSPAGERPLEIVQRSLDRAIALLQNMLDFSKFEAGKAALEERRFDVRELVYGVAQTLESAAERKGLALHVQVDPRVPTHLIGDAVKIGQVIANLVGNAVKFTDSGSVTVTADHVRPTGSASVIRFAVRDTGIGIPRDRLARIFDEYVQASAEIGARYGGAGLGLAISRRIVELHRSKIEVESVPGAGSTFSFELTLPVSESAVAGLDG